MNAWFRSGALILIALLFSCATLRTPEFLASEPKNKPWLPESMPVERANFVLNERHLEDGKFVGLALSGGGSRAASFGAEVMLALEEEGILQQVDVIACASAGCIPAAYYALQDQADPWEAKHVREIMRADLLSSMIEQLKGWKGLETFIGRESRTDRLASVLDTTYFHGKTFGNLRRNERQANLPNLLIHAMDTVTLRKIPFEQDFFTYELGSDLGAFPVGYAVAASMALPGKLYPVPLEAFPLPDALLKERTPPGMTLTYDKNRPRIFGHLADGGIVDNLAIFSLFETIASTLVDNKESQQGKPLVERPLKHHVNTCLLIMVDSALPPMAHQNPWVQGDEIYRKSLTRLFDDFVSDEPYSLERAGDFMMLAKWISDLRAIGFPYPSATRIIEKDIEARPVVHGPHGLEPYEGTVPSMRCLHWLISLDKLDYAQASTTYRDVTYQISKDLAAKGDWFLEKQSGVPRVIPAWLRENVAKIKTDLGIKGMQSATLFFAGQCLVHDKEVLAKVCAHLGQCSDKWEGKGCQDLPTVQWNPDGVVWLQATKEWQPFQGALPLIP